MKRREIIFSFYLTHCNILLSFQSLRIGDCPVTQLRGDKWGSDLPNPTPPLFQGHRSQPENLFQTKPQAVSLIAARAPEPLQQHTEQHDRQRQRHPVLKVDAQKSKFSREPFRHDIPHQKDI
jgi:hypothetical protein